MIEVLCFIYRPHIFLFPGITKKFAAAWLVFIFSVQVVSFQFYWHTRNMYPLILIMWYNLQCVSCDMYDTACVKSFVIHAMQAAPYQSDNDDAPCNMSCVNFDTRGTNSITSFF